MTLNTRNSIVLFGLIGTLVATIWVLTSKTFYAWQQERMVTRVLAANPAELLSAGRTLITRRQGFTGELSASSSDIPSPIRRLKPTRISMSAGRLGVDFGDVANPFGIIVYAAGVNPPAVDKSRVGPRKWIDGLWLYDDGQLETYGAAFPASDE